MTGQAAGRRDRRIWIDRLTTAQDASGAAVETWTPYVQLWAEARQPTGREILQAGQVSAAVDRVFVLLWRTDITAGASRIRFDGQVYDIVAATEIGRREGLQLTAVVRKIA